MGISRTSMSAEFWKVNYSYKRQPYPRSKNPGSDRGVGRTVIKEACLTGAPKMVGPPAVRGALRNAILSFLAITRPPEVRL